MPHRLLPLVIITAIGSVMVVQAESPLETERHAEFDRTVKPFFSRHCTDCHGKSDPEAGLSVTTLSGHLLSGDSLEQWRMIEERLRWREMPPSDHPQPSDREIETVRNWIRDGMRAVHQPGVLTDPKLLLPQFGNYVDHADLFDVEPGPTRPARPRLWRMRPEIYRSVAGRVSDGAKELSQPFSILPGDGFKDYAATYSIDEPATDLLLRNTERMVDRQLSSSKFRTFRPLVDPETPPTESQLREAIQLQYRLAMERGPTGEETERLVKLHQTITADGAHVVAGRSVLMAILLKPESLFRTELGEGSVDKLGRRRLSQREIAFALSYAIGNRPEGFLLDAAARGELATREQALAAIDRLLSDDFARNERVMQFFREYFGYPQAVDVFKDPPDRGKHEARLLVSDLEYLIEEILREDKQVLRELLTTNRAFVNYRLDRKRGTASPATHESIFAATYGLPPDWKWTDRQPIELDPRYHAGVLTHPAWLVAWSGNFDNHPVQRGLWVRTRLLGDTVPDVPIGVDARIPEDEHKTLRERLHDVSRVTECWRCHRKMNPLGLPFEQFDHYGRVRLTETDRPIVTAGAITLTDDNHLDGAVTDPVAMLHRLAKSERVEQVFIRHLFRFLLGRNETLGDAATLQAAHEAYRNSNGSLKATIRSILASESFLYRTVTADDPEPTPAVAEP